MKQIVLISLLLLLSLFSNAQSSVKSQTDHLDKLFTRYFKPTDPGMAVLAVKKDRIIYQKAFGSAQLELGVPLKTEHVFKIASVTKQFTAVAILQLMEVGKLALQDSIQQYLPDFPSKGHRITIEHLLTHSSGLKDYLQIDYKTPYLERRDFTPAAIIDSFKQIPLEFVPGSKYSYSNSGYFLLGFIIEKISGKSYYEYIRENLLQPAGLQHTCFEEGSSLIPGRVNGYQKEGSQFKNADYWSMSIAYSAGGLFSTMKDLWRWQQALLNYQLLKKETLEKAWQPYWLSNGDSIQYGYGWMLAKSNNIQSIEHGGSYAGFLSLVRYYPNEQVFLVLLCNQGNAAINEIALASSEILLGKKLQADLELPAAVLEAYTGTYTLTVDTQRIIRISKEKDRLLATIGANQTFPLLFESPTRFQLKGLTGVSCDFILENGQVTKLLVHQNGRFEWKKVK